ncbi:MAG: hypothetical protein V4456_00985 [Bacteroidota bacterium]
MQKKIDKDSGGVHDHQAMFSTLSYQTIIGLIQLLIDEGLTDQDERNGFYVNAKDFRAKAKEIYRGIDEFQKKELIRYCQFKRYLYRPFHSET